MTEEKEITNNEENIVKKTVIGSSEAVTASQDYNCKYNYSRLRYFLSYSTYGPYDMALYHYMIW